MRALIGLAIGLLLGIGSVHAQQSGSSVRPPANAVTNATPSPPGDVKTEDGAFWKKVRTGVEGTVSIPDKKAGVLVQSGGEVWREFRSGPLPRYGAYAMGGVLALLAVFYLIRGRIRLDHGWAGRTVERFGELDRIAHWLMAVSFIILGLTGLNTLYGRSVMLPVIGKETFAALSATGKMLHNYVAFAFMLGLALSFVLWIKDNIPGPRDIVWLLKGGGMFTKGSHPPAWKFNAGQKILFWGIMLVGLSISLSGLELMFPFKFTLFAKTFGVLSGLGFGVPASITEMQEMQFASAWHAIMGLVLVCVIFAHIYIGTLGMEGAFDAMATGHVDENWAKEHHSLWAERAIAARDAAEKRTPAHGGMQPAE